MKTKQHGSILLSFHLILAGMVIINAGLPHKPVGKQRHERCLHLRRHELVLVPSRSFFKRVGVYSGESKGRFRRYDCENDELFTIFALREQRATKVAYDSRKQKLYRLDRPQRIRIQIPVPVLKSPYQFS